MQIHELTQPQKPRLDEIEMFGPGGLASEIGSAVRNAKTVYNPIDMAKGLVPFTQSGKDARQRLSQAQADADQNELNRRASGAIAQGKKMGLDQKPTMAMAKERLRANRVAQEWISGTVAKWPDAVKKFNDPTPTASIDEAKVSRRRGSKQGANQNAVLSQLGPAAQAQVAQQYPELQPQQPTGSDPKKQLRDYIKSWINQQLKVVSLEAIASAESKGIEGLAGTSQTIKKNLDDMVANAENETAQQTALKNILVLATEANYLIDWERRVGRGQTLADPDARTQTRQDMNTGLSSDQLQTLGTMSARSGEPAPKTTGSDYWDSVIQQAIAAAKR